MEAGVGEHRVRNGDVQNKDVEVILDAVGYVKYWGICPKSSWKCEN